MVSIDKTYPLFHFTFYGATDVIDKLVIKIFQDHTSVLEVFCDVVYVIAVKEGHLKPI